MGDGKINTAYLEKARLLPATKSPQSGNTKRERKNQTTWNSYYHGQAYPAVHSTSAGAYL